LTAVLVVTSTTVQTKLIARTGPKPLVVIGMALGVTSMLLLTRLAPGASYASHVLPSLIITGLGMGCIFAPAFSTATLRIDGSEAGVASAMVNTSQQVGGSVGTALLSTIFASATAAYASSHAGTPGLINAASIHGYTTAFAWAAGIFALGFLLALLILPSKAKSDVSTAPDVLRETAVPASTPAVSAPAVSATPVLVTGPCCHFGVTSNVAGEALPDPASPR
jgi:MFS family permease